MAIRKGYRHFYWGYTKRGTFKIADSMKKFKTFGIEKSGVVWDITEQKAINQIYKMGYSIGSRSTTSF